MATNLQSFPATMHSVLQIAIDSSAIHSPPDVEAIESAVQSAPESRSPVVPVSGLCVDRRGPRRPPDTLPPYYGASSLTSCTPCPPPALAGASAANESPWPGLIGEQVWRPLSPTRVAARSVCGGGGGGALIRSLPVDRCLVCVLGWQRRALIVG